MPQTVADKVAAFVKAHPKRTTITISEAVEWYDRPKDETGRDIWRAIKRNMPGGHNCKWPVSTENQRLVAELARIRNWSMHPENFDVFLERFTESAPNQSAVKCVIMTTIQEILFDQYPRVERRRDG